MHSPVLPRVGLSFPTQDSWVRHASLLSQKWIQAFGHYAEHRREQKWKCRNTRACELSNSHTVGPLFWKGTSQEIKSPLYHRTQVASRKSTQFGEGESFEEHHGHLTIRSPTSKCFTAYQMLGTTAPRSMGCSELILWMEKRKPTQPRRWQIMLHSMFSPPA